MIVQPYIFLPGTCKQAMDFYCAVLGATVQFKMTYGEGPEPSAGTQCPSAPPDGIMHANLLIGATSLMMSDDPSPDQTPHAGYALSIATDDLGQGKAWFDGLSEGGTVRMPWGETFWAQGFGMLTDRFGVPWMVNVEKKA
ncbi:3-demethylubiquinone-9 3-methyltransferase [Pseudomonas sp. M47T1]|uniref:VOC family metalloprotein YjdN n=1 Tax=Pseudomonas sp. M47T1 TaxID=1179778 RepID=UPI0002607FE5|nr:VOC family metalloprotein YjdN [Pseudomonas sp. M47T1]EIK97241.1 3-demethylubiquinone-9 3-methyltransferase [Pseudomonas sp. M47T1]